MPNLLSSIPITTEPYIKVLAIRINEFESEIIDERNLGLTNTSEKDDFLNCYQDDDIVCLEHMVK
jgi:hypothetical protein